MTNNNEDMEFLLKLRGEFFTEAQDLLNDCQAILENMADCNWDDFLGLYMANLHNIKGSSKAAEFDRFSEVVHMMEEMRGDNIPNARFQDISLKMLSALSTSLDKMKMGEMQATEQFFNRILATKR